MMEIFERWGAQTSRYRFEFIDCIADLPTLVGLHKRSLPPTKSDFGWLLGLVRDAASRIEELAQGREAHGDATGWRNPGVSWRRAISDLSPDVLRPALSSGRC